MTLSRRQFLITAAALSGGLGMTRTMSAATPEPTPARTPNPDAASLKSDPTWLREARWGGFTHYLVHMPSREVPADMTPAKWNAMVDSFDVRATAEQFASVRMPYFFLTIGQAGGYYCSPNAAYERTIGKNSGKLSKRDLVAELAGALGERGIRGCVYLPGVARTKPEDQPAWLEAIREWSTRWGSAIHAWWIDGFYQTPEEFRAFTQAFKAGNPKALVSYNTGPVGMNRDQLMPATEYEDYLAGEVDYFLPTCGVRVFDGKEYYLGPDISGDQLHFLNFLGAWWGTGEPRFSNELVIAWNRHINDHGGTVTWDFPLSHSGEVAKPYLDQLAALGAMAR